MTTATAESTMRPHTATAPSAKSRIGLVVFVAIASGLSLGLVLVLAVFAGGPAHDDGHGAVVAPPADVGVAQRAGVA